MLRGCRNQYWHQFRWERKQFFCNIKMNKLCVMPCHEILFIVHRNNLHMEIKFHAFSEFPSCVHVYSMNIRNTKKRKKKNESLHSIIHHKWFERIRIPYISVIFKKKTPNNKIFICLLIQKMGALNHYRYFV